MANLTRILNNQIYSKTIIASQKIADGTITGSLFSSNVTVPGDFLITGNLFVLGTSAYTTVASTNTYVNDPLIVLNNGFAGTNTYDEGFVFNRGSLQNRALIWSEYYQEFRLIGTTETGTTYGNVAVSSFANLHIGNLTVEYTINHSGNFFTNGFINTTGNISGAVGNFGAINSTGLINTTGNISASQASVATLNATGLINTLGNISASQGSFATINATGYINTAGNISTAQLNAGQINTTGNVLASAIIGASLNVSGNVDASTVLAQLVTADDATFGNVAAGFIGNTGTQFTGASLNVSGNVSASTVLASYLTASTATVGNIAAVNFGNTGATFTGATINLSGNVNAATVLAQLVTADDATFGNVAAGFIGNTGTQFTGASLNVSGNVNASTVLAQLVTADDATFGNVDAAFIGNTGTAFTGASINLSGNIISTGAVHNSLTVNGTGTINAVTAGQVNSGFIGNTGTQFVGANLNISGNILASEIITSLITVSQLAIPGNLIAGLSQFASINSTPIGNSSPSTGVFTTLTAGQVSSGFIGNVGTAFTGASLNVSGNVLASTVNLTTLNATTVAASGNVIGGLAQFASINSTPIGNASPSTGTFTFVNSTGNVIGQAATFNSSQINGNETITGYLNVAGNVLGSAGTLNTLTLNSTANATEGTGSSGALQVKGGGSFAKDVWIGGNLYVSNIYATSYNVLTVNDPLLYLVANATYPYNYEIGFYSQFTGGAGNIYQHSGLVRDHVDGYWKAFSNVVAEPGSTITFDGDTKYDGFKAGNLILTDSTASTSTTTGALVVAGGAGIAGAINAASLNVSGNVLASTINATTENLTTLNAGAVNAGFIGNVGTAFTGASINLSGNVLATNAVLNALTVNGTSVFTTLAVTGNVIGGLGQFAAINATPIGNATPSTGVFTTATAGQISSGFIGNVGTAFTGASLNVSGNVDASTVLAQLVTADDATFGNVAALFIGNTGTQYTGASINLSGNVLASTVGASFLTASTAAVGNIAAVNFGNTGATYTGATINLSGNVLAAAGVFNALTVNGGITSTGYINTSGNVSGAVVNTGTLNTATLTATGNVIAGLAQFAAINATPIGNATASTGAFTTLSASAGIWGNSTTESTSTTTGALVLAGGLGLAGNIFQGGTRLETSASNYIFASTPTTVDAFKAATDLEIGATSGTFTVNNPTVVGTQSTQALYNTTATTMNFAGAATTLTAGATTGLASIRNAVINFPNATSIVTDQTSLNLFNANVTTLNAGGAATTLTLGATTGLARIRNQVIDFPNATTFVTNQSTVSIFDANVTQLSIGSNATSIFMGVQDGLTSVESGLEVQGVLFANVGAESTSATSGGLVVYRGAGIGGSLYVANSAVFNSGLTTGSFQIKSSTSGNVAFFANLSGGTGTTESVIIGGGNTVVQAGVTLKVGSQTSMMLPVGPTAARPSSLYGAGYDVPGMIRFNSTINNMEFYDGSQWQVTGSVFTTISDRQFSGNVAGGFGNVDGSNTVFTIQSNATTSGTIVSINGVMQFPTLAYSVSGTTLTFTEPPAPGDVIDVRVLTTTTTVSALTNGNGANQFVADDDGVSLWTGLSGGSVERVMIDVGGNINIMAGSKVTYDQTAKQATSTNLTLLDSFSANAYTTAKYVISMKQDTGNVQAMEALLTQSTVGSTAGTAYITTYGIVNTGNTMGTLAANVDVSGSWKVNMYLIPNAGTAISNVKVMTTYIV